MSDEIAQHRTLKLHSRLLYDVEVIDRDEECRREYVNQKDKKLMW